MSQPIARQNLPVQILVASICQENAGNFETRYLAQSLSRCKDIENESNSSTKTDEGFVHNVSLLDFLVLLELSGYSKSHKSSLDSEL